MICGQLDLRCSRSEILSYISCSVTFEFFFMFLDIRAGITSSNIDDFITTVMVHIVAFLQ